METKGDSGFDESDTIIIDTGNEKLPTSILPLDS